MKNESKIAVLCLLASLPFGVVTTVAPDYVPFLKSYPAPSFWAGVAITLLLTVWVVWTAVQEQQSSTSEKEKARMIPLIGMIICGVGFVCFAGWYFSVQRLTDDPPSPLKKFSLQYVTFVAHFSRSVSTSQASAVLYVELKNVSSYLIYERVTVSGQINGNTPTEPLVNEYDALIGPGETRSMSLGRIDNIVFNDNPSPMEPAVQGFFSFDILYWADGYEKAKRRTSKVISFGEYRPLRSPSVKPGDEIIFQTRVSFTKEVEE